MLFYRRWGFMVPWIIIYGINILGLFTASIVIFYSMEGGLKALGLLPLLVGKDEQFGMMSYTKNELIT